MTLTDDQKQQVAAWFAAGMGLSDLQKRIAETFGISMTYLDVRLLVAELPQPVEEEATPDNAEAAQAEAAPMEPEEGPVPEVPSAEMPSDDVPTPPAEEALPAGDVTVDMDAVVIPGMMASGNVTFSDGTSGKWYVDQMGRMGLGGLPEGYRPSPENAQLFQTRLMELFRSKGMM